MDPMSLNTHLWSEFWVALTRMKKENLTNLKKRCAACDCWNGNAKAPRPHQFYMRRVNATSAPPAHSLRSSCVNHARFIRNSLATVRWLCVVFRRVFVTHNHAFALFGAFLCLCAGVRGLLVICAWSFRSSCAIHRWFFITQVSKNGQILDGQARTTKFCAWFMRLREFWAVWLGLKWFQWNNTTN